MDLADIHGNVSHGVHVASMDATWIVMSYGFAGMRDYGGVLSFDPKLPPTIRKICFPLRVRGSTLRVCIEGKEVVYKLLEGEVLTIQHCGEKLTLSPETPEFTRPARAGHPS
jgi:alpha,alpha-trehalose phosphorylase